MMASLIQFIPLQFGFFVEISLLDEIPVLSAPLCLGYGFFHHYFCASLNT